MAALMNSRSSSSDSSSDEEERQRLQDAVVDETTFRGKLDSKSSKISSNVVKPSLRRQQDEEEEEEGDYRSIQATKGFKVHVAKKLEAVLDSSIVEIKDEEKKNKSEDRQGEDSSNSTGFMLFSTSDVCNTMEDNTENWEKQWNKRRKRELFAGNSSDSDLENGRLRAATVTQTDIIEMGQRESLYDESKKRKGQCETISYEKTKKRKKKKKHKQENSNNKNEDNVQQTDSSEVEKTVKSHHGNNCKKKKKKNKRDSIEKTSPSH